MSSNTDREQFHEKITQQIDEPQLLDLGTDLNFTKYALNYFDVLTIVQIYQETRLQFLDLMQFAKQNGTRHYTLAPHEPGMGRGQRTALQEVVENPGVIETRIRELRPEFYSPQDTRLIILYPELAAQAFSTAGQCQLVNRLSLLANMFPKQTLVCCQAISSGLRREYRANNFGIDVNHIDSNFVALHTLVQ